MLSRLRNIGSFFSDLFRDDEQKRIGIYGPPNAGKTTLANQICMDWSEDGEELANPSSVEHETKEIKRRDNVVIERNGNTVTMDIVDTPGVATDINYEEFLDDMEKDEAKERARRATEGVAQSLQCLREDIDGVIYVLDSTEDAFSQVNTMMNGIIESNNIPVLILANKIDRDDSNVGQIRNTFPQHETVPVSALEAKNIDDVYDKITEQFG